MQSLGQKQITIHIRLNEIKTSANVIRVPANLQSVAPDGFPTDIIILAPKDSQSAAWFKTNGYTVVEE